MVVVDSPDRGHPCQYAVGVEAKIGIGERDACDGVPSPSAEHIKALRDDCRVATDLDDDVGSVGRSGATKAAASAVRVMAPVSPTSYDPVSTRPR